MLTVRCWTADWQGNRAKSHRIPYSAPSPGRAAGAGVVPDGEIQGENRGKKNEVSPLMGVLPILKAKGRVTKCQVILGSWWYFSGEKKLSPSEEEN